MPSKFSPLIAFAGHAFTHSSHFPHLPLSGESGVRGMLVRRLFPNHPNPAALATALLGSVEEVRRFPV